MKPVVLLVDGYSLLFRGFHALPLLTSSDGTYTNAVHGFFTMLIKALGDYRPDGLAVMLDMHAPTFRHSMYADYKGNRKPMPEELRPQTVLLRKLLQAMNIKVYELEGYEGDDLLGSASRLAALQDMDSIILTGDRDSFQLIDEHIRVLLTRKGISESVLLGKEDVLREYGYTPEQVPDMKGLMGDSSDHIPGIAGVGEKTALKLLDQYGTLDNVLEHSGEIKGKLGEKIQNGKESALLSRDLGRIKRDAPIEFAQDELSWKRMEEAAPLLEEYGFNTILRGIRSLYGHEGGASVPRATGAAKRAASGNAALGVNIPTALEEENLPKPVVPKKKINIQSMEDLHTALEQLAAKKPEELSFYMDAYSISLYEPDGCLYKIDLGGDLLTPGLDEYDVLSALVPVLAQSRFILHGGKELQHRFKQYDLSLPDVYYDTMLAAYLLHTAQKSYSLNQTLLTEYGEVPGEENAALIDSLYRRQLVRLKSRGLFELLMQTEIPLSGVLFHMEAEGFLLDRNILNELSRWFSREVDQSREEVYNACGVRDFNLNSPKQLGEVLFERLALPTPQKKGKTGYSTAAEVLEELDHPCIAPLLRYRTMAKLQSTYIDGLRKLQGSDGRVHTTFDQTATVTGRISSQEPNLQNIPIRTEEGRQIRRAFIAGDGKILIDADYSQIELRVLAHMSGDEAMCDAFLKGQDIHARTASEINGVPIEAVTPAMRRAAKAVNFGIVYGISAFGLARNIGISRNDAKRYIELYFARYPSVKAFMDECVQKGYEKGYAQTLFGRRRELYELRSHNRNLRAFGERAAMNTPVQGTAADIIKMAMVAVDGRLHENNYRARLILQVHDELVIECPTVEADRVSALLKDCMENVCRLDVPLPAEVSVGYSWDEAH